MFHVSSNVNAYFFAGLLVLLTGCGDDNVKHVKNSQGLNEKYTNEQLLDHRKACGEPKWRSTKDERGRDIVEYTCNFGLIDKEINNAAVESNKMGLEKYKNELSVIYKDKLSTAKHELESNLIYKDPVNEHHSRYIEAKNRVEEISAIKEDYYKEVEKFAEKIQDEIDKLNSLSPERQQVINFYIINKEIESIEIDFLIDGKAMVRRVSSKPIDIFKAEVNDPDSSIIHEKWIERWAVEGGFFYMENISDIKEKFPYKCSVNSGISPLSPCIKS